MSSHWRLAIGAAVCCGACIAVAGCSAASPPASAATSASVRVTGLLTLKGPEAGAWWAVADDSGALWRLESVSAEQAALLRQWQNRRVTAEGVRLGDLLRVRRLQLARVVLAP